jgi:hypothetical protein
MGSFLSFPILNIINLAVNLSFLEWQGATERCGSDWKQWPIFVNGDDVLFCWTDEECLGDPWTDFVRLYAGFEKSVGKNFTSRRFCTINSTLFVQCGEDRTMELKRCPRTENLYNSEWYECSDTPREKLRGLSGLTSHELVSLLSRELSDTSADPHLAHDVFVSCHWDRLRANGRPWYLPAYVGGLGLPALEGRETHWRSDALLLAMILREHQDGQIPSLFGSYSKLSRPCDLAAARAECVYHESHGYRQVLLPVSDPRTQVPGPSCPITSVDFCVDSFGNINSDASIPSRTQSSTTTMRQKACLARLRALSRSQDLTPANLGIERKFCWLKGSSEVPPS